MRFKKHDGTYLQLFIASTRPNTLINFELVPLSNRTFDSVDRGVNSDRYSTTLDFIRPTEYINELVAELQLLRDNKLPVIIDEIEEPIFSDNIRIDIPHTCLVYKLGEQGGVSLGVQHLGVELLLESPQYVGSPVLPTAIQCVGSSYKGFAIWNTHINESYYRDSWIVDRGADTFEFAGEYILTLEDNRNLLTFWRQQRGTPFRISDGAFGVYKMFGGACNDIIHDVIITSVEPRYMNSNLRKTTIKLVKVG